MRVLREALRDATRGVTLWLSYASRAFIGVSHDINHGLLSFPYMSSQCFCLILLYCTAH